MTRLPLFRPALTAALASVALLCFVPHAQAQTNLTKPRKTDQSFFSEGCRTTDCSARVLVEAREFTTFDGITEGRVSVTYTQGGNVEALILCGGPAYVGLLRMQAQTRAVSFGATLNPASPDCAASGIAGPLSIALVGQATGRYASSEQGTLTITSNATILRQNYATDAWETNFNGTVGTLGVALNGFSQYQRVVANSKP